MSGSVNQSGKISIIDRSIFENGHTSNELKGVQKTAFHNRRLNKASQICYGLMDFLVHRPKQASVRRKLVAHRKKPVVAIRRDHMFKRHGKQREHGRRKRYTRLKKSVLRCRQKTSTGDNNSFELKQSINTLNHAGHTTQDSGTIHSRRFREYCDNCTTPHLCSLTQSLLSNLNRFQKRAHARNEIKAHANRRFVLGFREVKNYMQVGKVKLLCIATDVEACAGEAGIDSIIAELKAECGAKNIPYFFSLRRRQIAYAFYKKVPISCVGILDYDGVRDTVADILEELEKARVEYKLMQLNRIDETQNENYMSSLFEKKCVLV